MKRLSIRISSVSAARREGERSDAQSEGDKNVVADVRVGSGNGGNTDDELAHAHPESTVEEESTTSEFLDHVDTGHSCGASSARTPVTRREKKTYSCKR